MVLLSPVSEGRAPKVLENLKDATSVSPGEVTLKCDLELGEPLAEIKWFKGPKEIKKSPKYVTKLENKVASIVIHETEPQDAGVYRCQVTNQLGQVQTEATLAVHSMYIFLVVKSGVFFVIHWKNLIRPCKSIFMLAVRLVRNTIKAVFNLFLLPIFPFIIAAHPKLEYENKLKTKQLIKVGQSISLQVNISGIPNPTVNWTLNKIIIEKSPKISIETTDDFSMLTVKNATLDDTGAYAITAENVVGKAEAEFNVAVRGQSVSPYINKSTKYFV